MYNYACDTERFEEKQITMVRSLIYENIICVFR